MENLPIRSQHTAHPHTNIMIPIALDLMVPAAAAFSNPDKSSMENISAIWLKSFV